MINYKKTTNYLSKCDRLYIQRAGDTYYICNCYMAVYVPSAVYDIYFRTAKPCFIQLNDGEKSGRIDKKKLPEVNANSLDIKKIFDQLNLTKKARFLPLFVDNTVCGETKRLQYCIIGNDIVSLYDETISECFDGNCDSLNGETRVSGVLAKYNFEGMYLLPVNESNNTAVEAVYKALHGAL